MSRCDKHGHALTADRHGFASCWECDHEARTCCTRCQAPGRGEARYSYRVYAGRYCDRCWADERQGYRDHGDNDRPDSDLDESVDPA